MQRGKPPHGGPRPGGLAPGPRRRHTPLRQLTGPDAAARERVDDADDADVAALAVNVHAVRDDVHAVRRPLLPLLCTPVQVWRQTVECASRTSLAKFADFVGVLTCTASLRRAAWGPGDVRRCDALLLLLLLRVLVLVSSKSDGYRPRTTGESI